MLPRAASCDKPHYSMALDKPWSYCGSQMFLPWNFTMECNMYDVYLFDMLSTKFLLTKILEILIINKLL